MSNEHLTTWCNLNHLVCYFISNYWICFFKFKLRINVTWPSQYIHDYFNILSNATTFPVFLQTCLNSTHRWSSDTTKLLGPIQKFLGGGTHQKVHCFGFYGSLCISVKLYEKVFLFLRLKKSSLNRLVTIISLRPSTGRSNLNVRFAWPLGKKIQRTVVGLSWRYRELSLQCVNGKWQKLTC